MIRITKNDPAENKTQQTQIQTDRVEVVTPEMPSAWTWLRGGNAQLILAIAGVAVTLFNIWIATKLAPVAEDISTVAGQVTANDNRITEIENTVGLYLPRYIATEQQGVFLKDSVSRIEGAQIRIEAKLDRLIESRAGN